MLSATSNRGGVETCIRKARLEDLPGVLKVLEHLHSSEPVIPVCPQSTQVWQEILKDPRLFCFVADCGGQLVSTAMLDVVPNLTRGLRSFGVVQNVVTLPAFRGMGVGRKVMKYLLDQAWQRDCYQVLLQTGMPRAVGWYESLGFRKDKLGLAIKPEWNS